MNEVEKKEIDEMAKKIYETKDCLEEIDYRYGLFDNDDHFHRIARKLTITGYGKVEDYKKEIEELKIRWNNEILVRNSLFRDIDGYKKEIEKLKEENQELRTELSHREEDLIHADEKVFYRECNVALHEKEIKQQAIKEFAKSIIGYTFNEDGWSWTLSEENVDDLLKEYGIGEK